MISGLSTNDNKFIFDALINPLKSKGCKVFLFGSRATGQFKKFSDIDLLYFTSTTEAKINPSEIYKLIHFLEESNFIYKVDLVSELDLASSYKEKINAEMIEL